MSSTFKRIKLEGYSRQQIIKMQKHRNWHLIVLMLVLLHPVPVANATAESDLDAGMSYYKQRDFKSAAQYFKRAIAEGKNNAKTYLYLGHSYSGFNDRVRAVQAYSEIAQKFPGTDEGKLALSCLQRLDPNAARRFATPATSPAAAAAFKASLGTIPPTVPGSIKRRWLATAFPLRIYVSEGLQLPPGMNGRTLSKPEYATVSQMFKNTDSFRTFPRNSKYTMEDRNNVYGGLAMWNGERTVPFTQTNSPADADVLVFFTDDLDGNKAGVCAYPYEYRQPNIIQMKIGDKAEYDKEDWNKRERLIAAHEFGHAFGLDHSPDVNDVMYETEGMSEKDWSGYSARPLSEGDKAALKAQYSKTPGAWLLPVKPR